MDGKKKGHGWYLKWGSLIVLLMGLGTALFLVAQKNEDFIAKVHNVEIQPYQFAFFLAIERRNMEEQAGVYGNANDIKRFWESNIAGEDAVAVVRKRTLDAVQEFSILSIKSKEYKIDLDAKERAEVERLLQREIDAVKENEQNEDAFVRKHGVNSDQYAEMLRELKQIDKLMQVLNKDMNDEEREVKLNSWKLDPTYSMRVNDAVLDPFLQNAFQR